MVYSGVVGRTQIYLGDEELELLREAERVTGASRSELVRRAIHATFGNRSTDDRIAALRASAGSWKKRSFTGAEYVDRRRRGDLNERLARLGLD